MPIDRLSGILSARLAELEKEGAGKGAEAVISEIVQAAGGRGPRYRITGESGRDFIRMNANGYLGLALDRRVRAAEEEATRAYGVGPAAVRFISGTTAPHVALEARLAAFHGRPSAMIYSSAYAAVMGVLPPLVTPETAVISDALNHNSIINAARLAAPKEKRVYNHLNMEQLARELKEAAASCKRAVVVTDGVFSMRGDYAPLAEMSELVREHDARFTENALLVVDDSHGVGAFGATGRGTEEICRAEAAADLLIATLGKAFGVNGGYVTGDSGVISYLRETSPFYVYSNPITPGEAAAATAAVEIVDSSDGRALLAHLGEMTKRFEAGLVALGHETIPGPHPVVPLMVRDTARTHALIRHLRAGGVLATGLGYPVVPRGDEEIRFQVSADHTAADIDEVLAVLAEFGE